MSKATGPRDTCQGTQLLTQGKRPGWVSVVYFRELKDFDLWQKEKLSTGLILTCLI